MTNSITGITEIFTSRLQVLARLLDRAEIQLREKGSDPESLVTARLAADMFPFPHQIVFTCNQPHQFAAWCRDVAPPQADPAALNFAGLKKHVRDTLAHLGDATGSVDDRALEREKRIDLLEGKYLVLPGARFVDDWLMPNFYFHLVTAYDILRNQGIRIGKIDYMAHLAGRVREANAN
jgi:uncharacterized protein